MKRFRAWMLAVPVAGVLLSTAPARADFIIGPGTGHGETLSDTAGNRGNISITSTVALAAGAYNAASFTYNSGMTAGDVQPFLAVLQSGTPGSGSEVYRVIAAGADTAVTSTGVHTVAFGGSSAFALPTSTTVYAGFLNENSPGGNPVLFSDSGSGTNTAHTNGPPAGVGVTVNSLFTMTGSGGPTTFELSRQYAFSVDVTPTPAPPTAVLAFIGVAVAGAGRFARRRSPAPPMV